jgi:hypothetical protein
MESSGQERRFPPPWRVEEDHESFSVFDANGVRLAVIGYRNDVQEWRWTHGYLTPDEARRIAKGIARLPEFMMQRRGFYTRGSGSHRWSPKRPYHVALSDMYIREHWDWIDALCKLNGIPFNSTGETIQDGGAWWRVHEFEWQLDAIQFWDTFEGRWLRGSEFHYPERPKDLPELKRPKTSEKFDPRKVRG